MRGKRLSRKAGAILVFTLGLSGFVVILELFLRLLGVAILAPQVARNLDKSVDPGVLRILTLGESTTADLPHSGRMKSWPNLLEEMLVHRGCRAKVYNVARPAISTLTIVQELPKNLDEFQPSIVISMMGINDVRNLYFDPKDREGFWSQFRVIRLWKQLQKLGLGVFDVNSNSAPVLSSNPNLGTIESQFQNILPQLELPLNKDFQTLIKTPIDRHLQEFIEKDLAKIDQPRIKARYLFWLAQQAMPPLDSKKELYENSFYLCEKSLKFSFDDMDVLRSMAFLDDRLGKEGHCMEVAKKYLRRYKTFNSQAIATFSTCVVHSASKDVWRRFFVINAGPSVVDYNRSISGTQFHYRYVASQLTNRSIHWIVMQYPTLDIELLKNYFRTLTGIGDVLPEYSDISFLSNQENFKKALIKKGWNEIFTDNFAGTFGHTTNEGSQMIAETALQGVFAVLKKNQNLINCNRNIKGDVL